MVFFNYALRKLNAKIVYYGPGLCGKTTNLQWVHDNFEGGQRGKMISLATEGDRTIFFDLLPLDIGSIRGMQVTLQLYTVPGQVHYNSTRQLVLKGADGVVFVADSQRAMLKSNIESLRNLGENLQLQGIELKGFPFCLQFNKRDLSDLLTIEELDASLNEGYQVPFFEAVATKGIGVQETLEGIVKLVMRNLRQRYEPAKGKSRVGIGRPVAAAGPTAPSAPSPPAAPTPPAAPGPAPVAPAAAAAPPAPAPSPAPAPAPSPLDAGLKAPAMAPAPPAEPAPVSAPLPSLETAPPGPIGDMFDPLATIAPPLGPSGPLFGGDVAPPVIDSEPATDQFRVPIQPPEPTGMPALEIDATDVANHEEDLAAATVDSEIPEITFDDDVGIDEPELFLDEISEEEFDEDAIEVIEIPDESGGTSDAVPILPDDDFGPIEVDSVESAFDLTEDEPLDGRTESSYGIPQSSAGQEEELVVELDDGLGGFGELGAPAAAPVAEPAIELSFDEPISLGAPSRDAELGDGGEPLEITGFGERGGPPAMPEAPTMAPPPEPPADTGFDLVDDSEELDVFGGETFDDLALEVEEEVREELIHSETGEDNIATDRQVEPPTPAPELYELAGAAAASAQGGSEPFELGEGPFSDPFATTARAADEAEPEIEPELIMPEEEAPELELPGPPEPPMASEPEQSAYEPMMTEPEPAMPEPITAEPEPATAAAQPSGRPMTISPEIIQVPADAMVPHAGAIQLNAEDNQLQLRLEGTGAIAESGQVRALDITVPVPGTWVGNRRVTLQLRLTLEPTEDRDG